MYPKDQSDPRACFVGIDFTVEIRTPGVFDEAGLQKTVDKVIVNFFRKRHIVARPCHLGGFGSATGNPLMEVIDWVRENWAILTGFVTLMVAGYYKFRRLVERVRTHLVNRVIDPYHPSIVITVAPRTGVIGTGSNDFETERSAFSDVLLQFPELHGALVEKVPTHRFSLRAIQSGNSIASNAFFKLKSVTRRDVALMLAKIEQVKARGFSGATILMYRKFGIIRRFDVSKNSSDFYRLMRR